MSTDEVIGKGAVARRFVQTIGAETASYTWWKKADKHLGLDCQYQISINVPVAGSTIRLFKPTSAVWPMCAGRRQSSPSFFILVILVSAVQMFPLDRHQNISRHSSHWIPGNPKGLTKHGYQMAYVHGLTLVQCGYPSSIQLPNTPQNAIPGGEDPPDVYMPLCTLPTSFEINLLAKPGNSSLNSAMFR